MEWSAPRQKVKKTGNKTEKNEDDKNSRCSTPQQRPKSANSDKYSEGSACSDYEKKSGSRNKPSSQSKDKNAKKPPSGELAMKIFFFY